MDLKKIEKATKLLKEIKVIDQEIIEVEKTAVLILNDQFKLSFSIKLEVPSKNEDPIINIKADEHFSDMMSYVLRKHTGIPHFGFDQPKVSESKKDSNSITKQINDTAALSMLGIFICEKNKEREKLMQQLEQLGFNF